MHLFTFIRNFYWENGLFTEGRNRSMNSLFARQGDLDGACAVYSLMMMLMIHKKVNRQELEDRKQAQKATDGGWNSYMRLQDQFLSGLIGLYKDGYCFDQLADELRVCFKKKAKAVVTKAYNKRSSSKEKKELTEKIVETIKAGYPVEIGFTYKNKGGHAVVAIGYCKAIDKLRLFCLDPGFEMPETGFWNAIIDMEYDIHGNAVYSDIHYSKYGVREGTVDEILTIEV